jgi:hypothetical protein
MKNNNERIRLVFSFALCTLLILGAFLPMATANNNFKKSLNGVEVDQYQEKADQPLWLDYIVNEFQEFVPQKEKLVRVEVKIFQRFVGPDPLVMSVCGKSGAYVTGASVPASQVPEDVCGWVSFDVTDVTLTPGELYFIKLTAVGGTEYYWCGYGNSNAYEHGVSSISGWDYAFRTIVETSRGDEEIDQKQELAEDSIKIEPRYYQWQEFVPTKKRLSSVEIKVAQDYSGGPDLILEIHKPWGTVLTSASVPASQIPSEVCNWVSFDVPDITLIPGETYIIKVDHDAGAEYCWCGAYDNPYLNGSSSITDWDWCFRTYVELNFAELEIGDITGPFGIKSVIGNNGTASATNVSYCISIEGGYILYPKDGQAKGSFANIDSGTENPVSTKVLGFGGFRTGLAIGISATADNADTVEKWFYNAKIILFFVIL